MWCFSRYRALSLNGTILVFICLSMICECSQREGVSQEEEHYLDISMPDVRPTHDDHYLCTSLNVEAVGTQFIHSFEPKSSADRAHHMLLFTCDDIYENLKKNGDWWDCGHHYQGCKSQRIMYAWAKNAPRMVLPKDVGFRIGAESNIKNVVLQVHYAHPLPEGTTDRSGFRLFYSSTEPKYLAGIMFFFRSFLTIPPHTEKIHADMNCALQTNSPIHPFAYRVHTHKLGVVVSGYRMDQTTGKFESIGKGNPQWPQAFYPTKSAITINPRDYVVAQCTFSTTDFDKTTRIGMTAGDEMCNLYLMYYTKSRDPEEHILACGDEENPEISRHIPSDSDVPLPRNKTLEEHAMGHHHPGGSSHIPMTTESSSHSKKRPGADFNSSPKHASEETTERALQMSKYKSTSNWPDPSVKLGQVSGVDFDTAGNVAVFHRGDRVWDEYTFGPDNKYLQRNKGPIKEDTILIIDPATGQLLHKWGKDLFHMPHGIAVDSQGNFWLTDVALHQVFKFPPGSLKPSIILGKAFEPGTGQSHFCKPSAVAVMSSGDFFVADGYCNSRIIKFNSRGERILEWGKPTQPSLLSSPPPYAFSIPHALALAEERDTICVADRENSRIQCFKASTGEFEFKIESLNFGGRLFSVAYSPVEGGTLVAVNGPSDATQPIQGFIIPISTRQISSVFRPGTGFGNPHDVAISRDGNDIYVVEISKPYKVWKFSKNVSAPTTSTSSRGRAHDSTFSDKDRTPLSSSGEHLTHSGNDDGATGDHGSSFGTTFIIILAFLAFPCLLLIGIRTVIRLRGAPGGSGGAGFEKVPLEESDSENSDTEVEEFNATKYTKTFA